MEKNAAELLNSIENAATLDASDGFIAFTPSPFYPHGNGHFKLGSFIACGSYGIVTRGHLKPQDSPEIAVKLLYDNHTVRFRENQRHMNLVEMAVLYRASHPNVMPALGSAWIDLQRKDSNGFSSSPSSSRTKPSHALCILLPMMKFTLHAKIQTAVPYGFLESVYVLHSCLRGLQYLHEELGVIHEDLNMNNIFVDHVGRVLLGDFGSSQATNDRPNRRFANTLCSLYYRAPELLLYVSGHGTEVDIWSLGIIFVTMVTGRYPIRLKNRLDEDRSMNCPQNTTKLHKCHADVFSLIRDLVGNFPMSWKLAEMRNRCYPELLPSEMFTLPTSTSRSLVTVMERVIANRPDKNVLYSLLYGMLSIDPHGRLQASDVLEHPFFAETDHMIMLCALWDRRSGNSPYRWASSPSYYPHDQAKNLVDSLQAAEGMLQSTNRHRGTMMKRTVESMRNRPGAPDRRTSNAAAHPVNPGLVSSRGGQMGHRPTRSSTVSSTRRDPPPRKRQ